VDIPVRQANAMRKNRAKLLTFLPPLAMVDNKVHPPSNPIGVAAYQLQSKLPAELKGKLPTAKPLAAIVRVEMGGGK
jgi:hypothetical protein